MRTQNVYDPLISKRQQYLLATQVRSPRFVFSFAAKIPVLVSQLVRAVLKIGKPSFCGWKCLQWLILLQTMSSLLAKERSDLLPDSSVQHHWRCLHMYRSHEVITIQFSIISMNEVRRTEKSLKCKADHRVYISTKGTKEEQMARGFYLAGIRAGGAGSAT